MKINKSAFDSLKPNVLNFLDSLTYNDINFKFSNSSNSSIYSVCFAVFLIDLFHETKNMSDSIKKRLITYIQSYQDINSGFFIHENYKGKLDVKIVHQLTSFCLSALNVLDAKPKYKFTTIETFANLRVLEDYLTSKGCFLGSSSSGNMAMFIAIFLTFMLENTQNNKYKLALDKWFDLHNKNQNSKSGFWGDKSFSYRGFQNGLHQLLIYDYYNITPKYYKKMEEQILQSQDSEGFFAPYPGGSGCYDYDAVHILLRFGYSNTSKSQNVYNSIMKLYFAVLNNLNEDGGFCETKNNILSINDLWVNKKYFIKLTSRESFYQRIRVCSSLYLNKNRKIKWFWSNQKPPWNESDLWNTWLRCLTIAEIEHFLMDEPTKWNFQSFIGFGYLKKSEKYE